MVFFGFRLRRVGFVEIGEFISCMNLKKVVGIGEEWEEWFFEVCNDVFLVECVGSSLGVDSLFWRYGKEVFFNLKKEK